MGLDNIRLEPAFFQSFDAGGKTFDIVLLHYSINHLDETACINLLTDDAARKRYQLIFEKIAALSTSGAKLILSDCSRHNFFAALGLRNPIMPTIEWEKHQAPEVWAQLLAEAGFVNPRIRFNRLGSAGRRVLGNKIRGVFPEESFLSDHGKRPSRLDAE